MAAKKIKFPTKWEEFCKLTKRDPNALPDVSAYDDRDKKHALADFKLTHMIRYVNADKVDHTNSSQVKYEIWWWIVKDDTKPSGLGLSFNFCDYWGTATYCGPRFCFLSTADLKLAVEHWIDLFTDLIL